METSLDTNELLLCITISVKKVESVLRQKKETVKEDLDMVASLVEYSFSADYEKWTEASETGLIIKLLLAMFKREKIICLV